MDYFVYSPLTGEILSTGQCPDDMVALQTGIGTPVAGVADPMTQRFVGGVLTSLAPDVVARRRNRPHRAEWDWNTLDWVDLRDLAEIKAAKWGAIRQAGKIAAQGGFTAAGFNWDSDLETQQALTVTIQDMDAGDTTTWYTAEGEAKTLTFVQMRALGRALRNHLAAQRDKAATLRAQIAAATTAAEVAAIVW